MHERAVIAAGNNADWCDLICRTHGVNTILDQEKWAALSRSPPMYPDAVTLGDYLEINDVLHQLDTSPGCSIKDSFASLDLSTFGFRLLFQAEWIHRPPVEHQTGDGGLNWTAVRTPSELKVWGAAHGGGAVFRPALLNNPTVAILAAYDGDAVVGGVIGNRSASVVGVSNLFTTTADTDRVWAGAIGAVSARFPGLPLVGYEAGPSLSAANRAGFANVGPLRVWLKD